MMNRILVHDRRYDTLLYSALYVTTGKISLECRFHSGIRGDTGRAQRIHPSKGGIPVFREDFACHFFLPVEIHYSCRK